MVSTSRAIADKILHPRPSW